MEAMVLDKYFNNVMLLDVYQSFIWTDKYQSYGDFELYTPPTPEVVKNVQKDYYVWYRKSERAMIVETIEQKTDLENGDLVIIMGRSLESILERRCLVDRDISTPLGEDLQDYMEKVFNKCFGNAAGENREISNFFFERNPDLEKSKFEEGKAPYALGEFFGLNVYDITVELCKANNLGFKVTLEMREHEGLERNCFIFRLYKGVDRSYDQEQRPFVTFSSNFGNLLSSDYYSSFQNYHNFAYVSYEKDETDPEDSSKRYTVYYMGSAFNEKTEPKGLYRRETMTSGSVSSDEYKEDESTLKTLLNQQAIDKLKETDVTEAFDGEVDPYGQYQYGRDFHVGDIVQIRNHRGYEAKTRVTAVTFSSDTSGEKIYPTFEQTEDLLVENNPPFTGE